MSSVVLFRRPPTKTILLLSPPPLFTSAAFNATKFHMLAQDLSPLRQKRWRLVHVRHDADPAGNTWCTFNGGPDCIGFIPSTSVALLKHSQTCFAKQLCRTGNGRQRNRSNY